MFYTQFLISGDVQISVIYGQEPSHQCLYDNDDVTLTCTVNPLNTVVGWFHGTTSMVTCSNIVDNVCITVGGTTYPRHIFSSVVSNREFSLRINPVSPGTDAGVYKCEHGGASDSASLTLDACGRFPCIFKIFRCGFVFNLSSSEPKSH